MAIIDRRAEAFRRLPDDFAGTTVQGIGFDRDHLIEAGIERAGAVAAVTNGDNSNVLVARVARETFGVDRVVARIYDPRSSRDLPASGLRHRGDGRLDDRPGDAPPAARPDRRRVDRPDGEGVHRRAAGDEAMDRSSRSPSWRVRRTPASPPSGGSAPPSCRRRTPSPRRVTCFTCRCPSPAWTPSMPPSTLCPWRVGTDARCDRRRRQRGAVHR